MATLTAGNVIVEEINVGDIHYEYGWRYATFTKVQVTEAPQRSEDGKWTWKSILLERKYRDSKEEGKWTWIAFDIRDSYEVEYLVTEGAAAYSPKLFNYPYHEEINWW